MPIRSFSPVVDENSRILILGSIPSVKSLEAQEYYAYPRNAFWFIMAEIFDFKQNLEYKKRLNLLLQNGVALFDVIGSCKREGSLDSAIKEIEHQDFDSFFKKYPNIKCVFCNGNKAYVEFCKIYKGKMEIFKLPSTSPANARMTREEKLKAWEKIKLYV